MAADVFFPKITDDTAGLMSGWVLMTILLSLAIIAADYGNRGTLLGWITTNKGVASLAYFQFSVWTVVILSGIGAIVLANVVRHPGSAPLEISIPQGVWALMGITAASFAARNIVSATETAGFREASAPSVADLVVSDRQPGEDSAPLALSKVQVLFLTVIAAVAYYIAVGNALLEADSGDALSGLPELSQGLNAILAVSHVAYMAVKWPRPGAVTPAQ